MLPSISGLSVAGAIILWIVLNVLLIALLGLGVWVVVEVLQAQGVIG